MSRLQATFGQVVGCSRFVSVVRLGDTIKTVSWVPERHPPMESSSTRSRESSDIEFHLAEHGLTFQEIRHAFKALRIPDTTSDLDEPVR